MTPKGRTGRAMVLVEGLAAVVTLMLFIPLGFWIVSTIIWESLHLKETQVTTISNIFLVFVATMSLPLAVWAGIIAYQQSARTQQRLGDDIYHKNADLMGHEMLSMRVSAVRSLAAMMQEEKRYAVDVGSLPCGFVRHPPHIGVACGGQPLGRRQDVSEATRVLFLRTEKTMEAETHRHRVGVHGADLSGVVLGGGVGLSSEPVSVSRADLSGEILNDASLTFAHIVGTNLTGSNLCRTDMSNAVLIVSDFSGSDLSNVCLKGADVSHCNMRNVVGLTQEELDLAASTSEPPLLEGSNDVQTGATPSSSVTMWAERVAHWTGFKAAISAEARANHSLLLAVFWLGQG